MSKRAFSAGTWTPTATNDTTNLADNTHMSLNAGASQALYVVEIFMGGQAAASAINNMMFARNSTVGATLTALASPNTDGPLNTQAAAVTTVPGAFVAATTKPQRSSVATLARLNLGFNSFGGIVRWVAAPGEEWWIPGTGIGVESSLSNITAAAGAMTSSIVYELI